MPASITEEQKTVLALLWLDDQIAMTSEETPRYAMYQILRRLAVRHITDAEWKAYRTAKLGEDNAEQSE